MGVFLWGQEVAMGFDGEGQETVMERVGEKDCMGWVSLLQTLS